MRPGESAWHLPRSDSLFFNDTATPEIYTLSLHDALPIYRNRFGQPPVAPRSHPHHRPERGATRSEEHTSELQSRENLVCRLLLEKKKGQQPPPATAAGEPALPPCRTTRLPSCPSQGFPRV